MAEDSLGNLPNPPDRPASYGRSSGGAAPQDGPMSEDELKSILANEMYHALGKDGGVLSSERRRMLELYQGAALGNEVENRSRVVARNVYEAIEWVTPSVLKSFVSTDKVCQFEPYRPSEEPMAMAATEYVNYVLTQDNNFFEILFTLIKDAAIQKNGYIQAYWKEETQLSHESFTGLTQQEYEQVVSGDALRDKYPGLHKVQILDEHEYPNTDPLTSQLFPTFYDCKLRVHETVGKVCIENIAPEEMLVSRRCPATVFDGKHFVARRVEVQVSDLRERGYDEDLIESATGYDEMEFNSERISRFTKDDDWPMIGNRTDLPARSLWIEESYLSVDFDGDGVAELRRIVSAGSGTIIFENEEADDVPFISITLIPMPHKHIGMSIAESVADLQEIESTLWRQALDNLYISNMPRVIIDEMAATDETFEDLLNPAIGAPIRVANKEGIGTLEIPFTAQAVIPMIDQLRQEQEVRTGIMNQNMTLSPDQLNKYASGQAINLAQQAGSQRIELFARVVAETGVKELAKKVLGLVVRHQQQARQIKIAGQWVQFDPQTWRESLDVSVSVGLGTGNRDSVLMHLNQILQIQQAIVKEAAGTPYAGLVTPMNVYQTVQRLTENAGFKEEFFSNPQQAMQQPQQPPPNPDMMKAQVEMQGLQAKQQMDQQNTQAKMQLDQQKAQLDDRRAQEKHAFEMQRDAQKFQAEQIRDQQRFEAEMAREKFREQAKVQAMMTEATLQAQTGGEIAGA